MSNINDFIIENGVLIKYVGEEENVIIPDGITQIGQMAFERCYDITSIRFPNGLSNIGS